MNDKRGIPKQVIFMAHGLTFVSDMNGEQVARYQKPWLWDAIRRFEDDGIDPATLEVTLPDGDRVQLRRNQLYPEEWQWYKI